VKRLYDEVVKALNTADLRAKLAAESSEPGGMPPPEFARFIAAEIARWTRVVKEANIRIE
jgi:tripartite-type tricarboxylate transporter receptor subunit TctC